MVQTKVTWNVNVIRMWKYHQKIIYEKTIWSELAKACARAFEFYDYFILLNKRPGVYLIPDLLGGRLFEGGGYLRGGGGYLFWMKIALTKQFWW